MWRRLIARLWTASQPAVPALAPPFPRVLASLFDTGQCPDCGHAKFNSREDGGHDRLLTCCQCGSKFGVQDAPFNLIERVQ